jgi:thiosulfate/3-mercaptopyruvate sulfurtransferase
MSRSLTAPVLPNSKLLVSLDWLHSHLETPGLRILDVRSAEQYLEGHVPGAVRVELSTLTTTIDGVAGMLLPSAHYAAAIGALGVSQDDTVIIYDDNWGMPAARVLWGLLRYGHKHAAILNGGWDLWAERSLPVQTDPINPTATTFVPAAQDDVLAELPWIQARLEASDVLLLDTRTPNEYNQGHLPGASSWDWMNGVPVEGWEAIRPIEELKTELAAIGVTPDKEIVTYCRSGARAAHTFVLLRTLGYTRVRNYDGSWLEWSQRVLGQAAH